MKTLLYSTILVCTGLISLFILQSCQRPDGSDDKPCVSTTENYYLSDAEKNTLPYTGFDTLRMVSNLGDTIQCIGKGKQTFYINELQKYANPACGNTGTEKYYEACKMTFKDSTKNIEIVTVTYFRNIINDKIGLTRDIETTFRGAKYHIPVSHLSNRDVYSYIGDTLLYGKKYSSLNMITRSFPTDTNSHILISKSRGLIQIQLNPNEIWTILN